MIGGTGEEICNGGFATGPHVHFALFYNGAPYDLEGLKLSGWTIHEGPRDQNPYNTGYIERDGVTQTPWTWLYNDYHLYYGSATDTSLRFYGNSSSAVDRLKIPIDDPNRDSPGPMMDLGLYDYVVEWWIKANPGDNNAADITCGSNDNWKLGNIVYDRSSSFGAAQWGVSLVAGKVAFGVSDSSGTSTTLCSNSTIDDGTWHHIAIQRNRYNNSQGLYADGELWLFVDGIMESNVVGPIGRIDYPDSTPPGSSCGSSGTDLCKDDSYLVIGGGKDDRGLPFNGWIDDIRSSAWLRYFDDFSIPTAPHDADGLTSAILRFDSGSGNVAYDTGGYDGGTSNGWLYTGGSPSGPEWSTENPFNSPPQLPTTVTFAVIGDYGTTSQEASDVGALVASWSPDLVITTGDNNYPDGAASTIDDNIGQYYSDFIFPYTGSYSSSATENRFFPSLGNHDWNTTDAQPYLDYFTLPGNERYYDFLWGPVHFFAIDSDPNEPDGISSTSTQALWLEAALGASTAPWKVVYLHHAPYSSSNNHGSTTELQWPFETWGADVVLAGHDHTYERLTIGGIPYFVNGLGGMSIYDFGTPITGSVVRYNGDYGAMLVTADDTDITYQFINRSGQVMDTYSQTKSVPTQIFDDVPPGHWAFDYINALFNAGYVAGCSATPRLYCPDSILSRAESSVFVLRGQYGAIPDPPYPAPATPTFTDVDPTYWGFGWIESLWTDGFTAGCSVSPPMYRAEGSVFFLRVKNGVAYTPPTPTGIFTDVDLGAWYAGWVEAAYNEGILPECNASPLQFCPEDQLDRAWAAYMMVQAKGGLPLP
jgi:hypothetical protein